MDGIARYAVSVKIPDLNWQLWILIAIVGAVVGAGIWAFGVDKPTRVTHLEIAMRNIDQQRAELGVRETDHLGVVRFFEAEGADLDFSLVNRPRSVYTEPIVLSNDTDNAPSRVRITMRGLSDTEIKLGLRGLRPNRTWDSTRFPRSEPITLEELRSEDWYYMSPLPLRITYHQPIVDIVRLFVYIAGAFAVLFAITWVVWRRWLS